MPIIELNSSGDVANINVFAPDGLVARKDGSTWSYYTFDQQGNVAQRLNSSEVVQTSRVFDAWGEGAETTQPRSIDCWNYNAQWGYYNDRETGLYYCQNRMYDATTGRWINRDPIGYAGGINLYGYCGSGPVGVTDETGLSWRETLGLYIELWGAATGMVGGIDNIDETEYKIFPDDKVNHVQPMKPSSKPTIVPCAEGSAGSRGPSTPGFFAEGPDASRMRGLAGEAVRGSSKFGTAVRGAASKIGRALTARSPGSGGALGSVTTIVQGADTLMRGAAIVITYRRRIQSVYDELDADFEGRELQAFELSTGGADRAGAGP